MPYRRLPNTDTSRIKALKTAIEKSINTDFQKLAISVNTISKAKTVVAKFEKLCNQYQQVFDTQVKANILLQNKAKNARTYLSHFVQVLYMCIIRSEIKAECLKLYDLQDSNLVVPDLNGNEQLLEWGEKIIHGENQRIFKGGVPIYNPSIAKVQVMYSIFKEGYQTQLLHQKATNRVLNEVSAYRNEVDSVIFNIWEEVESFHLKHPADSRLDRNREYGVIYYYRKGETVEEK